ncbi:MAG: thiamine pyrophosphate-dependent dehydrogenase E1 component subunit alpha [Deltaproteobacteria bacterium]|nr:thiamine pyrophosphate-dependent dehydrogenase E1 component subunit alpha [Deltaproteobacteria bacterium]MDQ3297532.1 thiamine pyrophosphate-dependent dehydrogenase E1 component subunit alpha [Myxococcota bacterium]
MVAISQYGAPGEPDDLRRVLDDDGKPLPGVKVPSIPEATLTRIFEVMLLTRIMDDRMMRLQRQGRLGFYMKSIGEEASHFAVAPLRNGDWIFPSYREQGAWFWRGYTVQNFIDQLFGNEDDPIKGRQMPVHHSANWLNLVSISSPVGTQIPQAVGAAYAAKVMGKDDVSMVYFGEGTSSTGEFHVGMNFAGVWKAPCVFICRNNGWAISVPSTTQTAAKTFASKAVGYGMPGIRVDGNDLLAVWQVASEAIERARAGEGPTLIEALTYRVQGHSSSDDPSVYRDPKEPEIWEKKDPLNRLRGYLRHKGMWNEARETELSAQYNQEITDALAASDGKHAPPIESIFDDVYEELPWNLREQREYLMAQARSKNPHHHG